MNAATALNMALEALRHNHQFRTTKDVTDPEWPRNGFYIGSGAESLNLRAISACEQAIDNLKGKP
jgi:hypothetical protein